MSEKNPDTGGEPETVVTCTDCGRTYPAQRSDPGEFRPIGVRNECECGNDEFELIDADRS